MNAAAAYGLLAHGVLFGALVALLPLGDMRARAALAATAMAMMVGIAPAMHGIFGTPSLTLLLLATLQLAGQPAPLGERAARGLLAFALPFYAMALGLGAFDPYAPGYEPWAPLALLAPVGIMLWWKRQDAWLLILALDLAAYAGGLFANLWDALFDPLLVLLALVVAIRPWAARVIASRTR
jgi:hypothetical protein